MTTTRCLLAFNISFFWFVNQPIRVVSLINRLCRQFNMLNAQHVLENVILVQCPGYFFPEVITIKIYLYSFKLELCGFHTISYWDVYCVYCCCLLQLLFCLLCLIFLWTDLSERLRCRCGNFRYKYCTNVKKYVVYIDNYPEFLI